MKNKLLITTALVAVFTATNAYAEDEHITDDITISENVTINEDNAANYATTGNISVTGGEITASGDAGLIQLSDGNKKTLSISGGELIFGNGAGIYAEGVDGQYNTTAADMNITGGNITVKDGSEITLVGKADMNIGGNANITMDYTGVAPDNEHDGGILHEGQSGNLNISGGVINLTGEVAKIERGGYDGDWFYNSETGETMGENDGIKPAPEGADKDNYHISTGNINITGGEINLKDGARISLTEKNTGDLNISGGKITGTEIGNYGKGNVNISGGEITATDIGAEQGNVVISNGTVNVIMADGADSEGLYARDTMSIKGGTVNMSGNGNRIWGDKISMTGGTLNVKDSTTFETQNAVDISGGTVNIAENSSLGWASVTQDSIINLGSQATLNLDGTLNSHVNSTGNINFKNNAAKIAGNVTMNNGGVMNVGLNHAVVDGDATFNSGSTLKIEIADTDNHGSLKANNQVFGAVGTRLTGGTVSTGGEGMFSGDSIFKRGAMWVQGLFNKSKLDDTSKAKGFDADSSGIAFGAEKFVNDDVKVGVG